MASREVYHTGHQAAGMSVGTVEVTLAVDAKPRLMNVKLEGRRGK